MRQLRMIAPRIGLFAIAAMPALALALTPAQLRAPPGFAVTLYADGVAGARAMAWGDRGTLFVGSMDAGKVYALRDDDHDGRADSVRTVARGLQMPVGVAFRDGALYASSVDRIVRLDGIEAHLDAPPKPVVVVSDLPREGAHGWRFLAFGPDGKLYVPIGAPCNVCDRAGYAKLIRMNPDGSGREDVARGIRNTVGFAWHPLTHHLWFTDNGRDQLGEDVPDDELDVVTRTGQHFGFPYCHAGSIPDPEFGKGKRCADYAPPAAKLGAHVAAIGIAFYTGKTFPKAWANDLFVAEHGSWNRAHKSGYRVVRVRIDGDRVVDVTPFLTGFLDGETTLGRPTALTVAPDGALLVADDANGVIWRVAPKGVR